MNRVAATWALAAGVACALVGSFSGPAAATFADSAGFSGKVGGATCIACHVQADPVNNNAKAVLSGLPAAWRLGETYTLHVAVTGGPPALPPPQAQGGFDIASDGGTFAAGPSQALVRLPSSQEVTYLPAGTHQRQWDVQWSAPNLATRPAAVRFWLAVLAADGNHVIATNTSDQGELFDAADALTTLVAPDPSAFTAWNELPLAAPTLTVQVSDQGTTISGQLGDANATRLLWRLDEESWSPRDSTPDWTLRLNGLAGGDHIVQVRTEGAGRVSPTISATFYIGGGAPLVTHGATNFPVPILLFFLAFTALPRRNQT